MRKNIVKNECHMLLLTSRLSNQERIVSLEKNVTSEIQDAIRSFANLFTQNRVEVWNTLNILDEDQDYKSKVILSILIVSDCTTMETFSCYPCDLQNF